MSNATPSATSAAATAADSQPTTPAASDGGPTKEVRFAVVMYGGVSLCIYINGIAQELLHMVRATADDPPGGPRPLSDVEQVYRRLGQLLNDERIPGTDVLPTDAVRTRFSVDVLSGTSAGGINAVFLAKALAQDEGMDQLRQLWMTEGDIAKLINDGASTRDVEGLPRPTNPQALLNGQRMYRKLVEALEEMDRKVKGRTREEWRPLVPELDLFVTATDIAGVPLPLRLSDTVVHERRHRGVFHFHLKPEPPTKADAGPGTPAAPPEEHDHFARKFNPFLAFAARCTSAFPFAFEPMRLRDINAALAGVEGYGGRDDLHKDDLWAPFLERFRTPEGVTHVDATDRAFGDGGYLDNKPFSYASEGLLRREGGIPVDRKLIYIEPKPEHPEHDPARTEFDAIENVMAASFGLPRYETIREDLERVMARNRLTERVRIITQALERDLENATVRKAQVLGAQLPNAPVRMGIIPTSDWGKLYLADMVEMYGFAYGSYHRLRVAATTDWLASVVSRAAGLGDASDRVLGIRHLVRAWRTDRYAAEHPEGNPPRESENQFLLHYDLDFRVRRLAYVLSKVNTLFSPGEDEQRALVQMAGVLTAEQEAEFRAELVDLKGRLYPLYRGMRAVQERLGQRGERNPLHARLRMLAVSAKEIENLLALSGREQELEAERLLNLGERRTMLQDTADDLRGRLEAARVPVSRVMEELKEENHPANLSPGGRAARRLLWHYYDHYSDYDLVTFPILYSTDAGEEDLVDIIRISPEDAVHVLDERRDPLGRRKLAGTALFSFGGFLQDSWRANDILWGRMDGAERIICALLPDPRDAKIRDRLIEDACLAIIRDQFKGDTGAQVSKLMAESMVAVSAQRTPSSVVGQLVGRIGNEALPTRLEAVFGDCLDEKALLRYFRQGYEVNRDLDPQVALGALARGSRVVGHMLEGITERHSIEGKRVKWVTRAATWFWGLVQVGVPRSLPALLFDHWLGLFYTLAVLLVLVGVVTGGELLGWGVRILGAALAVHLAVELVRDVVRRRGTRMAVVAGAAVFVVLGLVALGVARVAGLEPSARLLARGRDLVGLDAWTGVHTAKALCGALGALILGFTLPALLRRPWKDLLPGGFAQPMLAAEFPSSAEDLAKLTRGTLIAPAPPAAPAAGRKPLSEGDVRRRLTLLDRRRQHLQRRLADLGGFGTEMAKKQGGLPGMIRYGVYVDYLFIAGYWLLFLLLANRLVGMALPRPDAWLDWLLLGAGVGAGVTGTGAALWDLVENGRIHEAFTAFRGREEDWMARGIRLAAAWKWGLVFVTVLLLSPLFFTATSAWAWALGAWWVVIAALGLWGALRRPRLLEWAFPALALGLLAAAHLLGRG